MNQFETWNREEYIAYWQKRGGKREMLMLIPYILGMLCFLPFTHLLDKHPLGALVWFPLFFGYLIVFPFVWMRLTVGKPEKKFLKCPCCKRPAGGANRLVITATGKCGFCGETILR
jgi:hypothetical protein